MADPAKIGMRRTRFECGRPLAENAEAASSANPPYVDIPRILRRRRRIFHAVPSASWRSMRSRIEGFELAAGLHRPGELIAQPPHACARPPTGAGPSDALVRYRGRLRHDRDDFGCSSALCIRRQPAAAVPLATDVRHEWPCERTILSIKCIQAMLFKNLDAHPHHTLQQRRLSAARVPRSAWPSLATCQLWPRADRPHSAPLRTVGPHPPCPPGAHAAPHLTATRPPPTRPQTRSTARARPHRRRTSSMASLL